MRITARIALVRVAVPTILFRLCYAAFLDRLRGAAVCSGTLRRFRVFTYRPLCRASPTPRAAPNTTTDAPTTAITTIGLWPVV